jgi:hypothetical protein
MEQLFADPKRPLLEHAVPKSLMRAVWQGLSVNERRPLEYWLREQGLTPTGGEDAPGPDEATE